MKGLRGFDSPWAGVCLWILRLGIGSQRAGFCFTIGSSGSGKSSVSAERLKNGAKMVLVIMDLRWDTSVEAVEFPIRPSLYLTSYYEH